MTDRQEKILAFEYSGGRQFVERVVQVLGLKYMKDLPDKLNIGAGTQSTWIQRNVTPFEIAIRVHLATGASMRWLVLGEGEPYPTASGNVDFMVTYGLTNGRLDDHHQVHIDDKTLRAFGLEPDSTHIIDDDGTYYFIDTKERAVSSGTYLICIDGVHSISKLQRLPNKVVSVTYPDLSFEVNESELEVLGKVKASLSK
ncbi:helix-turn-helix domain-containing protein [Salinivibrio kushneri]|uniref:Transcriptional regulator n=1 Tax=Salinivibrio kushneri TaxID=1908198 RepID=A0AB36K8R3_9GAMM|nr:helix-turn-helix domain-containing protein [Salinivibrio kushneri]OOE45097.1 hypothetical protein BZG09_05170 [Salinivibrio kushneri]